MSSKYNRYSAAAAVLTVREGKALPRKKTGFFQKNLDGKQILEYIN